MKLGSKRDHKPIGWTGLALITLLFVNGVVLGALFLDHQARTAPGFCATCHNMAANVASYLSSNHMDNVHYQANVGCRDCHRDYNVLAELRAVGRYLTGNYEPVLARRTFSQEMCTRCHISLSYHATRTDYLVRNPHLSHWPDLSCSDCHLSHESQIDYCTYCHDNGGQRMTGEPSVPRADNPWARLHRLKRAESLHSEIIGE
jgi:nitrate/TMAO reductase-like tetraheme cytochrome c subunit